MNCFRVASRWVGLSFSVFLPSVSFATDLELKISKHLSHDFNLDEHGIPIPGVEVSEKNVITYTWNTFFALNSPAYPIYPGPRGTPNSEPFGTFNATPVWDTYKQKRELFRISTGATSSQYVYSSTDPGEFDHLLRSFDEMSPLIAPCDPRKPHEYPSTVWNFLDESQEIGLATIWKKTNRNNEPNIPDDENLVRTQVKMNRDYFNYVKNGRFYDTHTLNSTITAFFKKTAENPEDLAHRDLPFGPIRLPAGGPVENGISPEGALLVKSSWVKNRILPPEIRKHYFTVKAMYYKDLITGIDSRGNVQSKVCYDIDQFSLIGIHFIHKTVSFPHFLFTTFQNVHNPQAEFYYANSNGDASTLPNPFGRTYDKPPHPQTGIDHPYPVHYDINTTPPAVAQANEEAKRLMAQVAPHSVWLNYALVGVQFEPITGPHDRRSRDESYYLSNAVIETNQRFQSFTGTFSEAGSINLLPHPYRTSSPVNMGGCMGCHGAGAQGGPYYKDPASIIAGRGGTDFSFILLAARSTPESQGVETLATAKNQIEEGGMSYPYPWLNEPIPQNSTLNDFVWVSREVRGEVSEESSRLKEAPEAKEAQASLPLDPAQALDVLDQYNPNQPASATQSWWGSFKKMIGG